MPTETRPINAELDATEQSFFTSPWGTHKPGKLQGFLINLTRRTFLQRGTFRHTMTNWITSLGRPIDVTFRGNCYRIEGRNNLIEYGLLTRPSYNAQELDFLCEPLEGGGTAVDIGCNIGIYSLTLAKSAGPEGRVISIDANPDMIRHLEFNASASGLNTVTAINCAVGESDAMVDLHIREDDVAIVSVQENPLGPIKMRPLLSVLEEAGISHLDSLKIDIEGYEDFALVPFLKNAPEALLPSRIVIEQSSRNVDYPGCSSEFKRLGYVLRGRSKINSLYERDKSETTS